MSLNPRQGRRKQINASLSVGAFLALVAFGHSLGFRHGNRECHGSRTIEDAIHLPLSMKAVAGKGRFSLIHFRIAFQKLIACGGKLALKEGNGVFELHWAETANEDSSPLGVLA